MLDAEVRTGELLKAIPKETAHNNPSGKTTNTQKDSAVLLGRKPTTEPYPWEADAVVNDTPLETIKQTTAKQQAREEIGITRKQADRFVALAENPEIVEQAKAEARENEDIVSRTLVLEKIKSAQREKRHEVIKQGDRY